MGRIVFITALECEAKVLIEHYKLKKDLTIKHFSFYRNTMQNIVLSVTGVGVILASNCISFLAGRNIITESSIIINMGIAGSKAFTKGSLIEINKISKENSSSSYYPIKLKNFNLVEGELVTYNNAVDNYPKDQIVDMEAYEIFRTTLKFVSLEQIWIGKVISDNNSNDVERLCKEVVIEIITKHLDKITEIVDFYLNISKEIENTSNYPIEFNKIIDKVKFSFSEKIKLRKLLISYLNNKRDIDLKGLINISDSQQILRKLEVENVF